MAYQKLMKISWDETTGFYVAVLPQLHLRAYGLTPAEAEAALEAEARRFLANLGRLEDEQVRRGSTLTSAA